MFRPIRWAISTACLLIVLYVFFCVPIGSRTLFSHFMRIARTPEAQELGHDVRSAGERVVQEAEHEISHGLHPGVDGGAVPSAGSLDAGVARPQAPAVPPARR